MSSTATQTAAPPRGPTAEQLAFYLPQGYEINPHFSLEAL